MKYSVSGVAVAAFSWFFAASLHASTYYESALDFYANGNFTGAEIDLRNALQESADNVPARVLLGRVLLRRDNPRAAAEEFERGLALGGDRNLILVPLAEVYLQLLEPEKVLTGIAPPGTDPAVDGEILILQGDAAMLLGNLNYAAQSYEEARGMLPGDARPLIGAARIAGARRRPERATELLAKALAIDPNSADALTLQGLQLRDAGDFDGALEVFDRALSVAPQSAKALGARAALLLDAGDEAAASADIDLLRALNPRDLEGVYLQSWIHVSRGDSDAAHTLLSETAALLSTIDDSRVENMPQVRLLFGIVSFLNGETEQAVEHLKSFLGRFPDHAGAQRYLAATYLAAGDWDKVIKTLEQQPGGRRLEHPASLALLAEALRARGDHEQASRYYSRALELAPDQVGFVLGLASSRFAAGDIDKAIASLERLTGETPEFVAARVELVGMYVDSGREEAALAAANAILADYPQDVSARNLLGVVMMSRGRLAQAQENFVAAREIEPDDPLVSMNQARLARLSDKLETAKIHYSEVLERNPQYPDAALELAEILLAAGEARTAAELIDPLLQSEPRHLRARTVQLWLIVARGDRAAIAESAFRFASDFPDDPAAEIALARIYRTLGDDPNAKLMLRRATEHAGFRAELQTEIASHQLGLGDARAAQWALTKALDGNPRYLRALALRVQALIDQEKILEAGSALAVLQKAYPERADTFVAEGTLMAAKGDLASAVVAYDEAHRRGPNRVTLGKLFEAQVGTGDYDGALKTIRIWILLHPGDLGSRHRLGESLLEAGAYRSAKLVYESLLKDEPDNPVSMNNLAFVLLQLGDAAALGYAERAVAAAPSHAGFLDTYGWVLVETGEPERGLEVLRDAFTRESTNQEIRYHIALALVRLNRWGAARRELTAAIANARDFPSRAEAVALLQDLDGIE